MDVRQELEKIIISTEEYDSAKLPSELLRDVSKWQWGRYGWVSPASLMFTAAWRKYFYPNVDCCKIWASDENNSPIPGGYSIRSEDEAISIPLLAKYDLCEDFCSPNSGMQGSRAIEKMRTLKRLDTDFGTAQRTVFDLKLFASILNQTNNLNKEQLLELIKFYIFTAKEIKQKRLAVNEALRVETAVSFDVLAILADTPDPELTKCVVAACLHALYQSPGVTISGVDDFKTAADARAGKPGDLCVERDGIPLIAIEVKDKTQHIDWNNIERAKRIIGNCPGLKSFVFVLESRDAATDRIVNEIVSSTQLKTDKGSAISVMSLKALWNLASPIISDKEMINLISQNISNAPAIKPETKTKWLGILK